jgi:hypothetical protein
VSTLDVLALAGMAALSVAFLLARRAEAILPLAGGAVLALVGFAAIRVDAAAVESILAVAGLGLYCAGLVIVRIMLHRSVSLRMLTALAHGRQEASVEDIRSRLRDLERYGLAVRSGSSYELTALGRAVAGTLAVLYRVTSARA